MLEAEGKRPDELAKRNRWQLEQSKAKKLENQIAACTIKAPQEGTVVYANPPRSDLNRPLNLIEEGTQVRERQKILSVIELNGLKQVNTKVSESQIGNIRSGMKARIRVDAFPNQLFDGTVVEVAPLPDSRGAIQGGSNVYTTKVRFDNGIPGLRPGMSARRVSARQSRQRAPCARHGSSFLRGERPRGGAESRRKHRTARGEPGPIQRQARRDHEGDRERRRCRLESSRVHERKRRASEPHRSG